MAMAETAYDMGVAAERKRAAALIEAALEATERLRVIAALWRQLKWRCDGIDVEALVKARETWPAVEACEQAAERLLLTVESFSGVPVPRSAPPATYLSVRGA